MALNASTYYSNAIQGIPGAGVDVDVTATHALPKYAAGYLIARADGGRFRYCHIGTATNSGNLVGQTTASGGATYGAITVVASASAVVVPQEYPILPGQVGSHYVEVTIASIAANKYQGGYFVTTRGTGLGETYRIVGNTATNTPATGNLRIQLAEPIKVAIVAATGVIIVPSIFTDLALSATSSTTVTGVLMSTTTSTNQWGWVCTRGPVGCAEDATVAITAGWQVSVSRTVSGAYAALNTGGATLGTASTTTPIVGYSMTPAASSARLGIIFCQCE